MSKESNVSGVENSVNPDHEVISTELLEVDEKEKTTPTAIKERTKAGVAWIKQEFLVKNQAAAKGSKAISAKEEIGNASNSTNKGPSGNNPTDQRSDEPPSKKKKGKRGMNKNRPQQPRPDRSTKLCSYTANGEDCQRGEKCFYGHSVEDFVKNKLPDIGERCIVFEKFGKCNFGLNCRFHKPHTTEDFKTIINQELYDKLLHLKTKDTLTKELQVCLRKRNYSFPRTDRYLSSLTTQYKGTPKREESSQMTGSLTDEDIIRLRPCEKKKIDFSDKLFLAPLTTVGNLPFRRICKQYGADITCSEMAMCTSLLQGQQSEWALMKRHHTEDIFGVQICGSFADTMTKCAELLQNEVHLDFVDINTGCPIDLVFTKGAGCALMERKGRYEEIVKGMVDVLDVPLTVKMRAGVHDNKKTWNAHKLVKEVSQWGASLITVHGRSREQRYTKTADWDYIEACVQAAAPVPLFGNGDVLSYEDSVLRCQQTGVAGLMVARGALIKPWIFTEIKEHRHWDISSHERFAMLKEYVNCGLEHWGSDTQGVENTRRFLLEWLSFLCRYIPVGLLEHPPQRINERPPLFHGRDDLETLMASRYSEDWVKLSEMLLGPVPESFTFLPKHKANSYAESETS